MFRVVFMFVTVIQIRGIVKQTGKILNLGASKSFHTRNISCDVLCFYYFLAWSFHHGDPDLSQCCQYARVWTQIRLEPWRALLSPCHLPLWPDEELSKSNM